ncbi:flavodoxin reductase [Erythrobacter donghaensis]|uniref:flavodoxin reductase n=1 Tax=Erythrobacter donghaensis TaxID=267135 RepID=UPI000A3BA96C|nr:flavodoxin reductase [Erythrobacter donghaensis]
MPHTLSLQSIRPVTHNVNALTFPRPEGLDFSPGQATELALDRDGWRDEKRPFTFASLPGSSLLEFVIKSYPDHDGVTARIGQMTPGDKVIIGDPWGAIEDRGPGTIIAGGAGITPFIAILRARQAEAGNLDGYRLIFTNSRARDIILRDELEAMPGLALDLLLTEEPAPGAEHTRLDGDYLDRAVTDFSGLFYLCGPPPMEDAVATALHARGVTTDRLIREES